MRYFNYSLEIAGQVGTAYVVTQRKVMFPLYKGYAQAKLSIAVQEGKPLKELECSWISKSSDRPS